MKSIITFLLLLIGIAGFSQDTPPAGTKQATTAQKFIYKSTVGDTIRLYDRVAASGIAAAYYEVVTRPMLAGLMDLSSDQNVLGIKTFKDPIAIGTYNDPSFSWLEISTGVGFKAQSSTGLRAHYAYNNLMYVSAGGIVQSIGHDLTGAVSNTTILIPKNKGTATMATLLDIPSLTPYVPYTGATTDVDLGTHNLTANSVNGTTGSFTTSATSAAFIKPGGTASQFLKANGTVDGTTYQSAITSMGYPYYNGSTLVAVNGGANDMLVGNGTFTSINPRIRAATLGTVTPDNTAIATGDLISTFANRTQGQINNRPTLDGTGATGTWPISITGIAATATRWGGAIADFTGVGSSLDYFAGFDATVNTQKPYTIAQVKTALGIPSGGINLQTVTDNGTTTTNSIGIGTTSITSGFKLDVNGAANFSESVHTPKVSTPLIEHSDSNSDLQQIFYDDDLALWTIKTAGVPYSATLYVDGNVTSNQFTAVTGNFSGKISAGDLDVNIYNPIYDDTSRLYYNNVAGTFTISDGAGSGACNLSVAGSIQAGYMQAGSIQSAGAINSGVYGVTALNTAPASATATGTTGEIRYTADYIYVCVATNTWKRTALTSW